MKTTFKSSTRRGFTLLEIMVAVGIIVILVTLVIGVGVRAFKGQEERATQNLLITLDRALSEYITVVGSIPKYDALKYDRVPGPDNVLVVNPITSTDEPRRPDAAVFIRQTRGSGAVDAIINAIDTRFLQTTIITGGSPADKDPTPSIVDTWALSEAQWVPPYNVAAQQIIYYVHPGNALAQELFGRCVNGRPYFVSAGTDRCYGLPEEGTKAATVHRLTKADQESPEAFQQRVLKVARGDNLYSYTVDTTFKLPSALIMQWQ